MTYIAEDHPAGPESIKEFAGLDGIEAFEDVHLTLLEYWSQYGLCITIAISVLKSVLETKC